MLTLTSAAGSADAGVGSVDGGVLLEHVPAAVAPVFERLDRARDVDIALAERPEQAGPGGVQRGDLVLRDGRGQRKVDVFQVDQPHPVSMVGGERDRVHAADGEMARIQAPLHVRAPKDLLHVLGPLHQGADVGVEHLGQAVTGRTPGPPWPGRQRGRPIAARRGRTGVDQSCVDDDRRHEVATTRALAGVEPPARRPARPAPARPGRGGPPARSPRPRPSEKLASKARISAGSSPR